MGEGRPENDVKKLMTWRHLIQKQEGLKMAVLCFWSASDNTCAQNWACKKKNYTKEEGKGPGIFCRKLKSLTNYMTQARHMV